MTDHTQAALHHLGIADHSPSVDNAISEAQTGIGHALLDIADAIRGLTTNTAPAATGDDLAHSQAEPGQVGGGKATEAGEFSDCPRCDRHLRAVQHFKSRAEKAEAQLESSRRGGVVLSAADYTTLVARAERAETERILCPTCYIAGPCPHGNPPKVQSPSVLVSRDLLDGIEKSRRRAIARAEQAEAERDAILRDLATIRTNYLNVHVDNVDTADVMVKTVTILLDRHTPEG